MSLARSSQRTLTLDVRRRQHNNSSCCCGRVKGVSRGQQSHITSSDVKTMKERNPKHSEGLGLHTRLVWASMRSVGQATAAYNSAQRFDSRQTTLWVQLAVLYPFSCFPLHPQPTPWICLLVDLASPPPNEIGRWVYSCRRRCHTRVLRHRWPVSALWMSAAAAGY